MSGGPRFTGRAGGGSLVLSAHDFTKQSPGAATFLPGHSVVRASDAWAGSAGYVGGNAIGRIATILGTTGLWIEPASTNLLPTIAISSWSTPGTVAGTVTGPDGGTAYHLTNGAGVQSFQTFTDVAGNITHSVWAQKNGSALFQMYGRMNGVSFATGSTTLLTPTWQLVQVTGTTTGGLTAFTVVAASVDESASGGINASALAHNCNVAYPQAELGHIASSPTPNSGGTPSPRAPEVVQDLASAYNLRGGADVTVTWAPDATAAQFVADGRTRLRLVGADSNYCIDVDTQRQLVRLVSGGVVAQLPTVLPTWAPGDVLAFSVKQWGSGTSTGSSLIYTPSGGAAQVIPLGTGTASLPAIPVGSYAINWFGDPNIIGSQLQGRQIGYSIARSAL